MRELKELFERNRCWAAEQKRKDPDVFLRNADKQSPKYLWIGCSDSRIPANDILDLPPGELFVHRNVANLFPHTDFNCLSVLQYAVEYLTIEHVIVCGHYGCAGVACAMKDEQYGLVDNWLLHIRDIYSKERERLDLLGDEELKYKALVELNVTYQVMNICHTSVVQNAWAMGRKLFIHGWVYDLETGILHDLNCCISSLNQVAESYRTFKIGL